MQGQGSELLGTKPRLITRGPVVCDECEDCGRSSCTSLCQQSVSENLMIQPASHGPEPWQRGFRAPMQIAGSDILSTSPSAENVDASRKKARYRWDEEEGAAWDERGQVLCWESDETRDENVRSRSSYDSFNLSILGSDGHAIPETSPSQENLGPGLYTVLSRSPEGKQGSESSFPQSPRQAANEDLPCMAAKGPAAQGRALGDARLEAPPASASAKQAWSDYETVFTNAKAGMDGVDKERVKKVVYEMSKGSAFFANEQRKEAAMQERLQRLQAQAARTTPEQLAAFQKAADRRVGELEASRDLTQSWMHVDMDAFYAAVETLHDPSLAGKPMGVGGMGMLCTANYEARKYGVRAAMPGFIAKKLCPDLIFVAPDFSKYTKYSDLARHVFREYDPAFIARSLDEAYLNLTHVCEERNRSAAEIAAEIRQKVREKTGLTCSAGVAANRLLAKVCSDINKPNGQYVLPNSRAAIMAFTASLPIRKVGGIGKVTEKLLKEGLGVTACGQLLEQRARLTALFSRISTDFFLAVGLGIGGSEEPLEEPRKSMSCERTFAPIAREPDLIDKLEDLAESLAADVAQAGLQARTLTLKLKTVRFEVRTRAASLPRPISTKEEILPPALKLLRAELPISVRLMGLRLSNFKDERPGPLDRGQRTLSSFVQRQDGGQERGSEGAQMAEQGPMDVLLSSPDGTGLRAPVGASEAAGSGELERGAGPEARAGALPQAHAVRTGPGIEAGPHGGPRPNPGGDDSCRGPGLVFRDAGALAAGRPPSAGTPWPCAACTFLNPSADARCRMCDTPLKARAMAPAAAGGQFKEPVALPTRGRIKEDGGARRKAVGWSRGEAAREQQRRGGQATLRALQTLEQLLHRGVGATAAGRKQRGATPGSLLALERADSDGEVGAASRIHREAGVHSVPGVAAAQAQARSPDAAAQFEQRDLNKKGPEGGSHLDPCSAAGSSPDSAAWGEGEPLEGLRNERAARPGKEAAQSAVQRSGCRERPEIVGGGGEAEPGLGVPAAAPLGRQRRERAHQGGQAAAERESAKWRAWTGRPGVEGAEWASVESEATGGPRVEWTAIARRDGLHGCSLCGAEVSSGDLVEHQDLHVALALQAREGVPKGQGASGLQGSARWHGEGPLPNRLSAPHSLTTRAAAGSRNLTVKEKLRGFQPEKRPSLRTIEAFLCREHKE